MIEIKSYAKINVFLEVESKREDGYHNIKSLFARIGLHDTLKIERIKKRGIYLELIKKSSNIPNIKKTDNIVYKAAKLFFDKFNIKDGVRVKLIKNIPVGAGLGGGSSNAASTLIALSKMFGIDISEVYKLGEKIGSDVMFFLKLYPFALCSGRGEIVEKIDVKSELPYIMIIYPDILVSTKNIYDNLKLDYRKSFKKLENLLKQLKSEKKINFSLYLFNRLQPVTVKLYPDLKKLEKICVENKISGLMSGSGSAFFILDYDFRKLSELALKCKKSYNSIFLTKFV